MFRIGVNLGDVVVEGEDLLGDGVNIAARLEQLCEPGGVLVSGTAFDHLQGRLGLPLEFTGEQQVKNIARPVRAYRVRLDGSSAGRSQSWVPSRSLQHSASALPSIAVLPFDDMSGQSTTGYFGDGVAEDIISMLSRVPELRVVARNSSFTFKGKPVDLREVGEKLGATHVLEGSVRKSADKLRIVAQLIDAKTGEHVWAERFDRTGTDPLALQDEVTEKVVVALAGDVGALRKAQYSEAWGKDHASLGEYDYFLRAEDLMRRLLPETNEQALQIATEGLSKFPNSALLKLELAHAYHLRGTNVWSDNVTAEYRQAGKLVREAMAQTGLSPLERRWGHIWSAFIAAFERKFKLALGEAEAAIELSPYDAYWLAVLSKISIKAGKPAQALEWIDRAASLNPIPIPRLRGRWHSTGAGHLPSKASSKIRWQHGRTIVGSLKISSKLS